MPELRFNIITREWVIIATERAKRPDQFKRKDERKQLPTHDANCPFCPGNEAMTPPSTYAIPDEAHWQVRVTPNKFAALNFKGERKRVVQGIRRTVTGVGIHEVMVETPAHNQSTALLKDQEVELIIQTYLDRFRVASSDARIDQVTIFKNHGEAAGTSLEHPHSQMIATPVITSQLRLRLSHAHPHSQMIATPVITSQLRLRLSHALEHFDEYGECIFCRVLSQEVEEGTRVVLESEHFVTYVQFATFTPFSFLIMPRRHMACFAELNDAEAVDLARILRCSLAKLHHGLADPDFNYVVRTAPVEYCGVKYYHWYVSVIPRLTRMAGFELGSGMFINVSLPENDAAFLRSVSID